MATTAHASAHGLLRHAVMRGIPAAIAADWLGVAVRDLDRPGPRSAPPRNSTARPPCSRAPSGR